MYSTVPGLRSRGDTQQPGFILQVGKDTPGSFVCNEVGEEARGFREVLRGLVRDSEREFELVFILDGLYEDGALVIPRSVRKVGKIIIGLPTRRWSSVHGSSVIWGRPISPRLGIDENRRVAASVKVPSDSDVQ